MRIGFNAELAFSNPTGMGKYARHLLAALMRLDHENEYVLFHSRSTDYDPGFEPVPRNFHLVTIPLSRRSTKIAWSASFGFALKRHVGRCDLYHNPTLARLPAPGGKLVVTVHDLACLRRPALYPPRHWLGSKLGALRVTRRADALIAISQSTKRDIVELMHVPAEKVHVIYYGLEPRFCPASSAKARKQLRRSFEIDRPYFLFVSDINPRKNVANIVLAFDRLNRLHKEEYLLVLAGRRGYKSGRIQELVDRLLLSHLVRFTDHVTDELPALMRNARALVYPSLYEGFGLPPLEAMACGTPVIAGNVTSMPEVLADAAILVDPNDVDKLAQAMEHIITDGKLAETLRKKGIARAGLYSWEKAARQTLGLYQQLERA